MSLLKKRSRSKPHNIFIDGVDYITYFRKTPDSIYCPHFWMLKWASGCPFDCAYCYLKGTFFGKTQPRHRNVNNILKALDILFERDEPVLLNSGELADSLMFPKVMEKIANKFEEQNTHKLLLLTKSKNVKFLLEKPRDQTVVSFSINAFPIAEKWEKRASHPKDRIKSAMKVKEAGYETRIRIDPIFPVTEWREEYSRLMDYIFERFVPDRVTLGTPRGLSKTLRFSKDRSWTEYFSENTQWGKKISSELRKEIYLFFFDRLQELDMNKYDISICKETKELWRELGLNYNNYRCNCIL